MPTDEELEWARQYSAPEQAPLPKLEPLPPPDERTLAAKAADLGLEGLGYVLTPLDYVFGAPSRAIKTLLAGGSVEQPNPLNQFQIPEFRPSGSGPGWDWRDVYDVPVQALKNAVATPSAAPTMTDIRRHWFPETRPVPGQSGWFYESNLQDMKPGDSLGGKFANWGRSVDALDVFDLGSELLVDPLTFITGPASLTARGKAVQRAGLGAVDTTASMQSRTLARQRLAALGGVAADDIKPGFTGLQPTLAGRLRAGEAGIGPNRLAKLLGVTPSGKMAGPSLLNKAVAYPVDWVERTGAAITELPGVGPAVKKGLELVTEPAQWTAEGVIKRGAEGVARDIVSRQMLELADDSVRDAVAVLDKAPPVTIQMVEVPSIMGKAGQTTGKLVDKELKLTEVLREWIETTQRFDKNQYSGPLAGTNIVDYTEFGRHAGDVRRMATLLRGQAPEVQDAFNVLLQKHNQLTAQSMAAAKAAGIPIGELSAGLRRNIEDIEQGIKRASVAGEQAPAGVTAEVRARPLAPPAHQANMEVVWRELSADLRRKVSDLDDAIQKAAPGEDVLLPDGDMISSVEAGKLSADLRRRVSDLDDDIQKADLRRRVSDLDDDIQKAAPGADVLLPDGRMVTLPEAQAALKEAQERLKSTVGYTAGRLSKDMDVAESGLRLTKSAAAPEKRTLGVFDKGDYYYVRPGGETEYVYHADVRPGQEWVDLEGVAMRRGEANLKALRTGTNPTAGQTPTARKGVGEAMVSWVKDRFSAKGAKQAAEEIDLFESDPIRAFIDYSMRTQSRALTRAYTHKAVLETANALPARHWDLMLKVADGSLWAEINAIVDPGERAKKLAAVQKKVAASRKVIDQWADRAGFTKQELEQWWKEGATRPTGTVGEGWERRDLLGAKKKGQLGAAPVLLPREWRQALDKIEIGTQSEAALRNIAGLMQTLGTSSFLRTWKLAQTAIWPAYHARNMLSDFTRLVQEGVVNGPQDIGQFGEVFKTIVWDRENIKQLLSATPDPSKLRGTVVIRSVGVPLSQVYEQAVLHGLVDVGFNAAVIDEAVRKTPAQTAKQVLAKGFSAADAVRATSIRENATRLAAFVLAQNQGDSPIMAAARAERALFNYRSVSPAADFLRKTGIAPFLSWTAKNVPRQLELMFEHPAQFILYTKAIKLYGDAQGEPPPDHLLPKWLRGKLTVTYSKGKDKTGKPMWWYGTVSGWMPLQDPEDWLRAPSTMIMQSLGPGWKDFGETVFQEEEDRRPGVLDLLKQLGGRPVEIGRKMLEPQDLTKESSKTWAIVSSIVSPIPEKELNVTDALRRAESRREILWRDAVGRYNRVRQKADEILAAGEVEVEHGAISPDDLNAYRQRFEQQLAEARADVEEARKVIREQRAVDARLKRKSLAP